MAATRKDHPPIRLTTRGKWVWYPLLFLIGTALIVLAFHLGQQGCQAHAQSSVSTELHLNGAC